MAAKAVVGVFESVAAAERARDGLAASGVAAERISLSGNLTEDGIAAEAPGQSYEHQSYGVPEGAEMDWTEYNSAVRTGACLLTVSSASGAECKRLLQTLRQQGARIAMQRPAP